jgi:hypothetical protein
MEFANYFIGWSKPIASSETTSVNQDWIMLTACQTVLYKIMTELQPVTKNQPRIHTHTHTHTPVQKVKNSCFVAECVWARYHDQNRRKHNRIHVQSTLQFTHTIVWTRAGQNVSLGHLNCFSNTLLTNTATQCCSTEHWKILLLFSTYALQPSRLIVRSGLDVLTFATRRLHACHHARAPSGGRWNCGQELSSNFA